MSTVSISEASRQLSKLVNRAAYGGDIIVLKSRGQSKAVLLGMEAFHELVGARQLTQRQLMPLDSFQSKFRHALSEAGYDSQEKVVHMVREIKRDLANERGS